MATSDQLKALILSHSEGDESRFYSVAMQVAAQAAKQGQSKLADDLRKIIDEAKEKGFSKTNAATISNISQPRGELAGLLSITYPKEKLTNLVLSGDVQNRLYRIILEQKNRDKLNEHNLNPRRKILIFGPPGTGKTMTASSLAGELSLPLYTIQLDGLITKFMGETAAKLRLIFDHINKVRGVYFFDEFDAIGSNRSSLNDVGEIRRILNSFLQFLEQANSESIVIAATNNKGLLDGALFRRFDDVIEYKTPSAELILLTIKMKLANYNLKKVDFKKVVSACEGLSYAEISRACEDAIKLSILNKNTTDVSTENLLLCLDERKRSS